MKKIIIAELAAIVCLSASCKPDKCEGTGPIPDECYDCQWHAPASATVSWSEHNTVSEVMAYFTCHRETLKENVGKTLKLTGWLYLGGNNEWSPESLNDTYVITNTNWLYITDNESHSDGEHVFSILLDKEQFETFMAHRSDYLDRKWYVTGILKRNDLGTGGCCSHVPFLEVVEFDTIKGSSIN